MMNAETVIFLVVAAGIAAGFLWGRRKGRERLQTALQAARATGQAEATAALQSTVNQSVSVLTAGGSLATGPAETDGLGTREAVSYEHRIRELERVAFAAHVLSAGSTDNGTADHDDDDAGTHDDVGADQRGTVAYAIGRARRLTGGGAAVGGFLDDTAAGVNRGGRGPGR